ncbi:hypothetical protein GCM10010353_43390 [Streptomyces chryseus]|nr:hypothetical protein GCM10010353_43390 [Streptomyces chryseus]
MPSSQQIAAQSVEDLAAHADGFGEGVPAHGCDHELLEVQRVVGVGAAVDDTDGRKSLVELSDAGRAALEAERGRRAGWLAQAIEAELTDEERSLLARSAALLERLAPSRRPTRPPALGFARPRPVRLRSTASRRVSGPVRRSPALLRDATWALWRL